MNSERNDYTKEYIYKVVVELDDEIILDAGRHDLEDTYRIVRKMFTDEGLHDVSEGRSGFSNVLFGVF